jgi:hypothetical protein
VVLTATPGGTNMTFTGWSGACTGTGTCTVTMDAARSVTATVVPPQVPLNITVSGNAPGFVRFEPEQAGCSTACTREFPAGTVVTITASKGGIGGAVTLSGDCLGGGAGLTATCSVTMTGPKTVNADFFKPPITSLTIGGGGTGTGSVSSSPAGIACTLTAGQRTGTCFLDAGGTWTMYRLTATPQAGSTFAGWTGCSAIPPENTSCDVTTNANIVVTATFTASPPPE